MSDHIEPPRGTYDGHTPEPTTNPKVSTSRSTATPAWVHTSTAPLRAALAGVGQEHIGAAATPWPAGQDSDGAIGDLRWVGLTEHNLGHADLSGATGAGMVLCGDFRHLAPTLRRLRGVVDLVLATPPARLEPPGQPAPEWSNAGLVYRLEIDLKLSAASWIPLMHAGTTIMLTSQLLHPTPNLTAPVARATERPGLDFVKRVAPLRIPLRDTGRWPRNASRKRRPEWRPRMVHEDVLVHSVPDVLPARWLRGVMRSGEAGA